MTDDRQQEVMQMLAQLYVQGGATAVRELLSSSGEVPDAVIEQLLTALEAQTTAEAAANAGATLAGALAGMLPTETINMLASNTVAVKTGVPDKLEEWRAQLVATHEDFSGRGADYANEVAFVAALLALLDDQTPAAMPPENPYQQIVDSMVQAIQSFRDQTGT